MSISKIAIGLGMLGLGSAFVKNSKQMFSPSGVWGNPKKVDPSLFPKGREHVAHTRLHKPKTFMNKPYGGAFWTSSLARRSSSDWIEWCIRGSSPKDWPEEVAIFEVNPNARILNLNNLVEYTGALRKYGVLDLDVRGFRQLNWDKIKHDYDGATCKPGYDPLDLDRPHIVCPATWDVESTVWFNMDALKFLGTKDIKNYCRQRLREIDDP